MPWGIFDRKAQDSGEWSGFLEHGTKLEGKLESPGTLRIDSHVKGAVVCESTLILGENARGNGELTGNSVIVAGQFEGTIRARSKVELQPKAIVTGEIETPNLTIEPGATFDGRCHLITGKESATRIIIPIRSATAQP
jgi:cytoskeletal protein CcmA (bactofilin family)